MTEFRALVEGVLTSPTLTYDQRLRQLAAAAVNAMPYPDLSPACREALDKRVVCDMFEGNRPYAPRYVLPDYSVALRNGSRHLELDAPTNLADALSMLTILYGHVPSVTTYPVYLGDLDKLLAPFVTDDVSDEELDTQLRRFWIQLDRLLPDAFVHTDLGPEDSRVARSVFRVERSLRQVVPNITLKVDPERTPDSLVEDGVRTVFETAKPHFVNHPMMVGDHGEDYAAVSCYNSLKIGGGSHTLVRLNLKEAALRHEGGLDGFLEDALAIQDAGCFSMVLEGIPADLAAKVTETVEIPTIGIGAGSHCSGQVLVFHDVLGLLPGVSPKFVRRYAEGFEDLRVALASWAEDVRSGGFPDGRESYTLPEAVRPALTQWRP